MRGGQRHDTRRSPVATLRRIFVIRVCATILHLPGSRETNPGEPKAATLKKPVADKTWLHESVLLLFLLKSVALQK